MHAKSLKQCLPRRKHPIDMSYIISIGAEGYGTCDYTEQT